MRKSRASVLALSGSIALHGAVFGVIAGAVGPFEAPTELGSGRWAGDLFMISTESPVFSGIGVAPEDGNAASASPSASDVESNDIREAGRSPSEATAPLEKGGNEAVPLPAKPAVEKKPSATKPRETSNSKEPSSEASAAASQATTTGATSAKNGSNTETGGGTFGSEGATLERGRFPDAFTRVLPVAAQGLRGIFEAGAGSLGRFLVRVTIDDEGKLVSLVPTKNPTPVFVSLFRSTLILLRSGRFALPAGSHGEFLVGLDVSVSEEASETTEGEAPLASAVRGLSHTRPHGKEPGIALVRYASGKRITLVVDPEPNPKEY